LEFCKICHDRGVIVSNDIAIPCTCGPQRALLRRIKESGLPKFLYDCTFDNFDFSYYQTKESVKGSTCFDTAKQAYQAALDFVAEIEKNSHCDGLFISGPVGSGKTFLACCIANALLAKGFLVLFVIVPDLLDHIRSTYKQNSGSDLTEQDLLDTAKQVPLLILDDLGSHNYTEWVRNKLYSILNHRLNYCLPTIITTNINLEDLDEFLGERTTSRIYQMCRPYRLMVIVDIRIAKRKKNQK